MSNSLPLYLASGSPRRRQLLTQAGIEFELLTASVDEDALTAAYAGPLERLGEYLAASKARVARAALRSAGMHGRLLTADTTVLLDGVSLPKPRDGAEARDMLECLRGREHVVATGVTLASTAVDALAVATSYTRVLMRNYSEEEVSAYVASGDPLDKAGSYSLQHEDFHPVTRFDGCHLGVIGLPVCIVAAMLGSGRLPPADRDVSCVWSAACTPPLPTPDAIRHTNHDGEQAQ